ncbi:thioredoxin domain-containing protein (plasmid) [Rossellomorea sp. AcN35-11]|nr:thioredoxin domain-containing protein [Rossellomorea sp. AcN35-11]
MPGLDYELLSKDIAEQTYLDEVDADKRVAINSNATSTPAIFINGKRIKDAFDYDEIQKAIEAE